MDVLDTPAYQQPCTAISPFLFLRLIHSHLREFCLLSVRDVLDPVRKNDVSKWFWSIFSNNNTCIIFTDFIWVWNLASAPPPRPPKERWYKEWISKRCRGDYADLRGKKLQKDVQNFTGRICTIYYAPSWSASWSSGQSLCLLITRSRLRFPALLWEFSLKGRIPTVTMVWVG